MQAKIVYCPWFPLSVTVLWVLLLLSLMAANFTLTIRTEINLTRNLIDNATAEAPE